jgi:hypothetical protein
VVREQATPEESGSGWEREVTELDQRELDGWGLGREAGGWEAWPVWWAPPEACGRVVRSLTAPWQSCVLLLPGVPYVSMWAAAYEVWQEVGAVLLAGGWAGVWPEPGGDLGRVPTDVVLALADRLRRLWADVGKAA